VASPAIAMPFLALVSMDFFSPIPESTIATMHAGTYSGARNQEKIGDDDANTIPTIPPAIPNPFSLFTGVIFPSLFGIGKYYHYLPRSASRLSL
jgi:hypothetical protein